jgi:hypothetical protein
MAAMGERFLLSRLTSVSPLEQANRALTHIGKEQEMRRELREAVTGLFAAFTPQPFTLTPDDGKRLSALASIVALCRSSVERDGYRREIELVPGSERPARLVLCLARLLHAMRALGEAEEKCWPLIRSVGLDCIPDLRRRVFEQLRSKSKASTKDVSVAIAYPTVTVRRALEDLTAHGVLNRHDMGQGHADEWEISEITGRLLEQAESVSEKSEGVKAEAPEGGVSEKSEGVKNARSTL